jgi:hypothetical protein
VAAAFLALAECHSGGMAARTWLAFSRFAADRALPSGVRGQVLNPPVETTTCVADDLSAFTGSASPGTSATLEMSFLSHNYFSVGGLVTRRGSLLYKVHTVKTL